jgi:hypothetical protein
MLPWKWLLCDYSGGVNQDTAAFHDDDSNGTSVWLSFVVDDSAISSRRSIVLLEQSQKVVGAVNHSLYSHDVVADTE